jgi:fumarate reductase subunit C
VNRPLQYHPTLPGDWWLRHPNYLRYMLRELTCVPIFAYVALLIVGLWRLGQGPEAWEAFRLALATPPALVLQGLALLFAIYHSISWFALAPRTMPMRVGTRQVPPVAIAAAHYLVWILLSFALLWAIGV